MIYLVVFSTALFLSVISIRLFKPLAVNLGLVDKPSGHKTHQGQVPLVGGFAIYMSLIAAWIGLPLFGIASMNAIFMAASGLLFTVGLLDDRFSLSVRLRMAMQVLAALLLVYSKVVLEDFGYLLTNELLTTGMLAVPLTVFAIVGVINSMNMLDGIDGLAGLVSVAILTLLLIVATVSEFHIQILIILCMLGSLIGFLLSNLRRSGFNKAKIFMGDAGSTLLGFMLAYLLISMSQGEQRAISPVTALWLFAIPLMDTLRVMLRRIWQRKSPFAADRVHLHHLLMDAGLRVRHVVYLVAIFQLLLGIVGLTIHYLAVPESISFMAVSTLFTGYAYLVSRPWRIVSRLRTLHRATDLIVRGVQHIYVGNLSRDTAVKDIETILGDNKYDHHFEIYEAREHLSGKPFMFAVIDAKETDNVKWLIGHMKKTLNTLSGNNVTHIRQYILRNQINDRRKVEHADRDMSRRQNDRRANNPRLIYRSVDDGVEGKEVINKVA